MPLEELYSEIAAGVVFSNYVKHGQLVGVMGVQSIRNVRLLRPAYVLPEFQGAGIGS